MFSDPISFTVNGGAKSLVKVSSEALAGKYRYADGTLQVEMSHQIISKARIRSLFKFIEEITTTDPLVTAENKRYIATTHLVCDRPVDGFAVADIVDHIAGLATFMTASSNANATKFIQLES
jgi:hypothetical protein